MTARSNGSGVVAFRATLDERLRRLSRSAGPSEDPPAANGRNTEPNGHVTELDGAAAAAYAEAQGTFAPVTYADKKQLHELKEAVSTIVDPATRSACIETIHKAVGQDFETYTDRQCRVAVAIATTWADRSEPTSPEQAPQNGRQQRDCTTKADTPTLDGRALHGLPGKLVQTIAPETEADPAAVLLDFLCSFGSAVGCGPHMLAGNVQHPGRLFVTICGESAGARKGTAFAEVDGIMKRADPEWARHVVSGLSSGEGLIRHAEKSPAGHGVLVRETEFARVLKAAARDGSTLSPVLRQAWDSGDLRVMTKESVSASGAHISIAADITVEELRARLTGLEAANGFANRFLFAFARRSNVLPHGGKLADEEIAHLAGTVKESLEKARSIGRMRRSSEGDRVWERYYARLADESPGGLFGGIVSRGEPQVLRLSIVYALADGSATIEPSHLHAAWAVWRYCRDSAELVFGNRLGDPLADRILAILRQAAGQTLKRSELHRALARASASDLDRAVELLARRGVVTVTRQETAGRWGELIVLVGS